MARLTKKRAVEIAREYGLDMSDAAALVQLADTEREAEEFAAVFAEESPAAIADRV